MNIPYSSQYKKHQSSRKVKVCNVHSQEKPRELSPSYQQYKIISSASAIIEFNQKLLPMMYISNNVAHAISNTSTIKSENWAYQSFCFYGVFTSNTTAKTWDIITESSSLYTFWDIKWYLSIRGSLLPMQSVIHRQKKCKTTFKVIK